MVLFEISLVFVMYWVVIEIELVFKKCSAVLYNRRMKIIDYLLSTVLEKKSWFKARMVLEHYYYLEFFLQIENNYELFHDLVGICA